MHSGVLITVPGGYPRSTASYVNNCAPRAPKAVLKLPDDQLRTREPRKLPKNKSKTVRTPGNFIRKTIRKLSREMSQLLFPKQSVALGGSYFALIEFPSGPGFLVAAYLPRLA
jgi:hypothetical protein